MCFDCDTTVGRGQWFDPVSSSCMECGSDNTHFYPRLAIHRGLSKGYHLFEFNEPFRCPGCEKMKLQTFRACEKSKVKLLGS